MNHFLLLPPSEPSRAAYHDQVVTALGAPVVVKAAGDGRGKGVFLTKGLAAGDVVWVERALAGQQDRESRTEIVGCDHCHRVVGTIEQRIAQLLQHVQDSAQHCQGADSDSEDDQGCGDHEVWAHRLQLLQGHVTQEQLTDLANNRLQLPLTDRVQAPAPVPCPYGCQAVYCSQECVEAAWQQHHCLLCPGTPTEQGTATSNGAGTNSASAAGASSSAAGASSSRQQLSQPPPDLVDGFQVDRSALQGFYQHADTTNDIFRLAAKLLAQVALHAQRLALQRSTDGCAETQDSLNRTAMRDAAAFVSQSHAAECGKAGVHAPEHSRTDAGAQVPCAASSESPPGGSGSSGSKNTEACAQSGLSEGQAALAAAFLPYSAGWKRVWWESVAVPEDVEDEGEFREQLRDLASTSLALLCTAWPGVQQRYPDLLDLTVWGSVIGMFELNNLGLTVPSPVEDYFLMVDELPEDEKQSVQPLTQPWLDALDQWYDTQWEGTGFFALHSCINHSCDANCTTLGLADGRVEVYATKDIPPGTELTINYLNEGEGDDDKLTYDQRQELLRDYGFTCTCTRCAQELRQRAARKGARKGVKVGRR